MENISGQITVEAPSNIAFVKYWGKTGRQLPINPSISMTLKNCVTTCRITYKKSNRFSLESYLFEGKENEAFKSRIEKYLLSISDICPILKELSLSIETENSFPHSAGIASSASAFGAIGYGIAHIEGGADINKRASELARLGSGSAARSIAANYTVWGEYAPLNASDNYAIGVDDIHPDFADVKDTILLLDTGKKAVSSSDGHALMDTHPFKEARIAQASANVEKVISAMRAGDWQAFGDALENEALTLHSMMMTSQPSVMLLMPETLMVIEKVKTFRKETGLPVYFTIDAGPNVHLIYPESSAEKVEAFIANELSKLCKDGRYIVDSIGKGARLIND